MSRKPDWTTEEFEILRASSQLSDQDLVHLLPGRTVGAVGAVRAGIHSFHRGDAGVSILSRLMVDALERHRGTTTCPVCGVKF